MNKRPILTLSKFKNKPLENPDALTLKDEVEDKVESTKPKSNAEISNKIDNQVLVKSDKLEKSGNPNEVNSSLKKADRHSTDTRSSNKPKGKQESHIVESNNKEMKTL
jgi:hypothetical protein